MASTAGARIRAGYQASRQQAEAYVRGRRGNLVIEIAPGSAAQFLSSAAASQLAVAARRPGREPAAGPPPCG